MSTAVHYLCPHTSPISAVPSHLGLPSSSISGIHHHPLSSLLFCEECDAIRCDQCVNCELNCYYCPNCLFEVPSANIRAQKNRCGRNCFVCPLCQNTLSAVATDPPSSSYQDDYRTPQASIGEPPYFLACTFCRWDSKQVGISFEKPTFLAQQLQQAESSPPELLEFDRLKDHFEAYLKAQNQPTLSSFSSSSTNIGNSNSKISGISNSNSSAQMAASLALSKQIPSVTKYGTQLGAPSSVFKIRSAHTLLNNSTNSLPTNLNPDGTWKEDLGVYQSLFPVGGNNETRESVINKEQDRLRLYMSGPGETTDEISEDGMTAIYVDDFAPLEKRRDEVWYDLDLTKDLRPMRVALRSKKTKRCPTCQHILIKPEQKAQSIRFKIKLIASNYLPLIELCRKRLVAPGKHLLTDRLTSGLSAARKNATSSRTGTGSSSLLGRGGEAVDEKIRPDRKYQFELTFVNPLYEPISVKISIAPPQPILLTDQDGQKSSQIPYSVQLLASEFTIAAFAEVWEYDEEDEKEGAGNGHHHHEESTDLNSEVDDLTGISKRSRLSQFGLGESARRRTLQSNTAITKKANRTTVVVETKCNKNFVGLLQADMLVTFTYRSDDLEDDLEDQAAYTATSKKKLSKNKRLTSSENQDSYENEEDEDEDDENQKSFTFWTRLSFGEVSGIGNLTNVLQNPSTQSALANSSLKKKKKTQAFVET
ncbi:dynactin p62 family-domain-containing protein [Phakopsora pachyrhizi]|uniref:Dynactin subunit 4 n=1 Tax=Phakopsora pachyrhizi TaxID=170000 RepID=A0AAV0BHV3_PHAPC|nr:dynactin p62 family-domain-containing protein [Phakopsora pachyrhizi]CAH7686139.1 dynactin p62 family-domain-containing protein [Phakopsora pachyrhizi]